MATALQSPNITAGLCLSQGDFENSFKPDHHHLPSKQIHIFERDDVLDGHCAPVDLHDIGGGRIFVRDPPFAELLAQNHSRSLAHIYSATQSITSVVPSSVTPSFPMAKKRRSLQSILIPSFLHSPPSSVPPTQSTPELRPSRARSHSELIYHPPLDDAASRASSSFLLDEDPFANLSTAATQVTSSSDAKAPTHMVSPRVTPRSPLSPCTSESANRLASPIRSSPATMSSFPRSHLTHPAHKRPAFAPRPSLPSLHALAQMNAPLVLPRKHRKGKVGARLPFEPWELGSSTSEFAEMLPGPPSSMPSSRGQDFTSDLDTDFLDFTDDNDGDDDDFDDFDDPTAEAHFSADFDVRNEHSFQMQSSLSQEHLDISLESLSGADSSSSLSRSSSSSRSLSSSSSLSDSEDRISRDSESRHGTSRRSDDSKHSTSSGQPHSSSAESDSDIPNSPPDESYFIFPRSLSPDCLLVDEDHEELDGVGYELGSGVDVPYHGLDRTPHHSIYFHHANSLSMGSTDTPAFEPGSSEGTIRGSSFHAWALSRGRRHSNKWMTGDDNDEMVEGSEWQGGQNGHYSSNGSAGYYGGNSAHGRASDRSNGGFGGGSNWGNGGDDGDDRRRRRGREGHGHHTEPTSGSEEEQSESEDDYGVPSASQSKKTVPNDYSASDDDVPLAQRIPTALRAQKTIRRKVKEERDQRRRERAAKAALNEELHPPHPRTPLTPAGPSGHYPAADSQEPNVRTRSGRMRTMTMPSNSPRPFAVDDLSKRLEAVQIPEPPTRVERSRSKSRSRLPSPDRNPFPMPEMPQLRRSKSRHPSPDRNPPQEPARTLRPMRSFHRTETRPLVDRAAPPIPVEHQKLARSKTEGRSRRRDDLTVAHGVKSKSLNMPATETLDIDQFARGRRQDEGQSTTVHLSTRQRSVSRPSRPSMDRDPYPVPRKSLQRQTPSPLPPLPLADIKTTVVTQQRVFIGDMQSFNTVEISSNTTAQDVLDMVKGQGSLKQFIGSGGWMLFEVAQDFGMERPIRSFELLADVQASWNKDKMVNMFVIKMTALTSILSRSNIPSSSPMHSGWVEWEAKRGKWTKRWMQLREHSLWLSKRDSGKDETFLCSLSNFDAYAVTRVHKAPKPYVFATKSTDNLSFFENTADYLHVFSCSQKDGEKWMEVILLARSYVLYQEKNVLFNPKAGSSSTSGTGLSRSGTRKTPSGRTGQTFVDVSSQDVFVPGSLLHRKS